MVSQFGNAEKRTDLKVVRSHNNVRVFGLVRPMAEEMGIPFPGRGESCPSTLAVSRYFSVPITLSYEQADPETF